MLKGIVMIDLFQDGGHRKIKVFYDHFEYSVVLTNARDEVLDAYWGFESLTSVQNFIEDTYLRHARVA